MFETISIPFIWYILIVIGSVIGLIFFGLYIATYYHFGKPMAPFLHSRVKRWTDKNTAIFEVISLIGNVSLDPARHESGGYRRLENRRRVKEPMSGLKKLATGILTLAVMVNTVLILWDFIGVGLLKSMGVSLMALVIPAIAYARQPTHDELVGTGRPQPVIMPKSVYTVNCVPTIPLLDLHPPLHEDLKRGLQKLIDNEILTPADLEAKVKEHPDDELIPGYTYSTFSELYSGTRQKYEFQVKVSDVASSIKKNYDKNFKESLAFKDFNAQTKKRTEDKYIKYGYAALILIVLAVVIKLLYFTFWR